MATLKEKQKLIQTIKTPNRYFRLSFTRYGGEVAMGTITKDQYEYWTDNDGFEEYMGQVDYDADEANKEIPKRAQFDQPFYEYSNICHLSGPEWHDSQTMYIEELDKDGRPMETGDGHLTYVKDIQHDYGDLESLGAEIICEETHNTGSKSCENEYYVFGQYFNKGGWHTPDIIKTGPDGLEIDKLKIRYTDADGFKVFNEIEYDGEVYYLEEDSTGKSSSFYVSKGDNLK